MPGGQTDSHGPPHTQPPHAWRTDGQSRPTAHTTPACLADRRTVTAHRTHNPRMPGGQADSHGPPHTQPPHAWRTDGQSRPIAHTTPACLADRRTVTAHRTHNPHMPGGQTDSHGPPHTQPPHAWRTGGQSRPTAHTTPACLADRRTVTAHRTHNPHMPGGQTDSHGPPHTQPPHAWRTDGQSRPIAHTTPTCLADRRTVTAHRTHNPHMPGGQTDSHGPSHTQPPHAWRTDGQSRPIAHTTPTCLADRRTVTAHRTHNPHMPGGQTDSHGPPHTQPPHAWRTDGQSRPTAHTTPTCLADRRTVTAHRTHNPRMPG